MIDIENSRVLNLLVKKENAVDDDQATFKRGRQGVEAIDPFTRKSENGNEVKDHRRDDQDIFKDFFLKG